MARIATLPRTQILLSACALVCAQAIPVFGEPIETGSIKMTGAASARVEAAAKPAAAAATNGDTAGKPAAVPPRAIPRASRPATARRSASSSTSGHTAGKPGATSARGAYEYDFNLKLATLIDQKLRDAGFAKTVLLITKDTPYYAGLFKRAERAQAMSADLFLSIHHDSVPDSFLQKWEYQGVQRSYSDRFKGHSIFISRDNGDYRSSLMFAKQLGQQLKDRGLKYTPHYTEKFMGHRQRILVDADVGVYRYDQLIVLRNNRTPAVLLEAGSIINRDEELQMASPERRGVIGAAAVAAVENYCAERSSAARSVERPVTRSADRRQAGSGRRR